MSSIIWKTRWQSAAANNNATPKILWTRARMLRARMLRAGMLRARAHILSELFD